MMIYFDACRQLHSFVAFFIMGFPFSLTRQARGMVEGESQLFVLPLILETNITFFVNNYLVFVNQHIHVSFFCHMHNNTKSEDKLKLCMDKLLQYCSSCN